MRYLTNLKLAIALLLTTTITLTGCADEAPADDPAEAPQEDVCEQAARHQESCTGEYITPPVCDEGAAAGAEKILATDCEDFDEAFPDQGKADGAFCDWFGAGCTPDEAIFGGPACESDADCAGGSFCVEQHCFDGVTSEEFTGVLDLFTETVEEEGSFTYLLVDNAETRQFRRDLVEGAEHSVHFTAFIIEDDEVGAEMVELFSAAARRGVEVRVVVDATTQYMFSSYDLLKQMAEAGVQIIPFNAVNEWAGVRLGARGLTANDRLHEKMLIVDGAEAIIGGRNVGDAYLLADRWRDIDVYVEGPGVAGIQRMFLGIWDKNSAWEREAGCKNESKYGFYCPPGDVNLIDEAVYYPELEATTTTRTRAIYSDPYHQETALGYFTTLALVRAARHSITIANSYFVPPRRLRKHLRAAAARGVEVNVLTNSKESTDAWWMYYASLNYYKELLGAGIHIHQYNGTETMHAKTMLIDDELAVVGSFNFDPRSAIDNSESMLLIRDGQAVDQLRQTMAADIANSTPATDDIPLSEILKARSFRIVEPLL